MPTLRNARHEKFALGLSEGKSASQAYIDAGYKPCRQNAARLTTKDDIKQRLAELQDATARSTAITVESICRELDAANAVAKERGQASAMVSASALRAKLAGLLVEKVEVSNTHSFDQCETMADLADEILAELVEGFYPVDEKDKEGLEALFYRDTWLSLPIIQHRSKRGLRLLSAWISYQPIGKPCSLAPLLGASAMAAGVRQWSVRSHHHDQPADQGKQSESQTGVL